MTATADQTREGGRVLDGLVAPFGIASAALLTAFAGFQVALALGAPWGEHVWGNAFPAELPPEMRAVSVAAALILLGMATVVLARANVVMWLVAWRPLTAVTWGISGYMAFNTVGNLTSQSNVEKYLFGRATFVLAALIAYVAYRGPRAAKAGIAPSPAVSIDRPREV